jgi:hypothetical protein
VADEEVVPLHPLTGKPLLPVGFRLDGRPIWPILGAAPDDDEGDEGDGDEGDAGDGDEGEEDPPSQEWKPPTKEEWTKVQNALKKANRQAQTEREKGRKASEEAETASQKDARELEDRFNTRLIRTEARAALLAAGAKADRVAALVKLTDLKDVRIDKDGEVEDLDTVVELAKAEYPEFFDGRRVPKTGNAGTGEKKEPKKTLSYAEQLFANART